MNVGILGAGAMGAMLARAHARFGSAADYRVAVANRSSERLHGLADLAGSIDVASAADVARGADLLFACVPSSAVAELAGSVGGLLKASTVFACTSSAVDLAPLARLVPGPILRVIPSILHTEGRGISLVTGGPRSTPAALAVACRFLASFSKPLVVDDAHTRVATDITACGPALMASLVALLAESAARRQAAPELAALVAMARETLCGVAALLDSGWSAQRIEREVATPGGTTQAGLAVARAKLPPLLDAYHDATLERATHLRSGIAS